MPDWPEQKGKHRDDGKEDKGALEHKPITARKIIQFPGYRLLRGQSRKGAFDAESESASKPESVALTLFFTREEKTGKTVKFYASAPSIGIEIPIDRPIDCDYDEVCAFVDRIYENTEDNFFVLEDEKGNCIQFMHDGDSERLDLDIPVAAGKGSYRGEFSSLHDVKNYIRSFYSGVNITFDYPVKFETW